MWFTVYTALIFASATRMCFSHYGNCMSTFPFAFSKSQKNIKYYYNMYFRKYQYLTLKYLYRTCTKEPTPHRKIGPPCTRNQTIE